MPTPFFFSRLPEALRGLMTKHTPSCIHNTVVLLLHSSSIEFHKIILKPLITDSLHEKRTTSVQRTNHLFPIDFTNIATYQTFREADTSCTRLRSSDTDQARVDTRSAICITRLPLRMDKCYSYKLVFVLDNLSRRDKGPAPNVSACEVLLYFGMMFSRVHDSRLLLNS